MLSQIPCSCIVDHIEGMAYEVCVTGGLSYSDHRRTYVVKAVSEDDAARQGLNQFCEEMTCLDDAKDE